MPLPIVEQPMVRAYMPPPPPTSGFTLLEHSYSSTDSVYIQTPEQVILHLVARILHLGDGPRRVAELSDTLNAKMVELTRTRMFMP